MAAGETDRVAGALLGLAVGDALGAGYEFSSSPPAQAVMIGGGLGGWAPGEWTDDTQMAICIAEVTATGSRDLDAIGQRFLDWYTGDPADVGNQTRAVLGGVTEPGALAEKAAGHFAQNPRGAAGNGSLMRTAPVALACLGDDAALAEAAMAVSGLTHGDPLAGEACLLWCVAIDRAVRQARLDGIRDGLALLDDDRAGYWRARLDEAAHTPPGAFTRNGFVVTALQAALAAVWQTPEPSGRDFCGDHACGHFEAALHTAVSIGDDTDTVAAIAGALLGARWGASAVPFQWWRLVHGSTLIPHTMDWSSDKECGISVDWPGYTAADLVRLAVLTAKGGATGANGWPAAEHLATNAMATAGEPAVCRALPDDPAVTAGTLSALAEGVDADAVVSLCRVGCADVPRGMDHYQVFLVDQEAANPNGDFVLDQAVEAVRAFRAEGKRVFVHCVGAGSRTPTVVAGYLVEECGFTPQQAIDRVSEFLPYNPHNRDFQAWLQKKEPGDACH